ncbi:MAG: hypothetical protein AB7P97_20455 [Hyphomonadaceae bacterium]
MMDAEAIETIRKALEASKYEFITLMPRLPQPYHGNAKACAERCTAALLVLPPPPKVTG